MEYLLEKCQTLWRSLYKYTLHVLTGECEIARICSVERGWHTVTMSYQFAKSLKQSKQLVTNCKTIFSNKLFSINSVVSNIITIKRLSNSINSDRNSTNANSYIAIGGDSNSINGLNSNRNNNNCVVIANITNCLQHLQLVNSVIVTINCYKRVQFDWNKEGHYTIIDQLWDNLYPEIRRKQLQICEDWKELGFQGTNPATDFRGMGLFGLLQLHYFSDKKKSLARKVLWESINPNRFFPFAAIGINFTAFVLELLTENRLHHKILLFYESIALSLDDNCTITDINTYNFDNYSNEGVSPGGGIVEEGSLISKNATDASISMVHEVYYEVYEHFYNLWIDKNPKDIMAFPTIFNEVKNNFRAKYPTL